MLPIGEHRVRDITFSRLRGSEKAAYEYQAVIENRSSEALTPTVTVLLFDRLGIQLGRSQVVATEPKGTRRSPALRPGEIRTFFSVVDLDLDRDPFYFLLAPTPGSLDLKEAQSIGLRRTGS